jgi:hypothetical protein
MLVRPFARLHPWTSRQKLPARSACPFARRAACLFAISLILLRATQIAGQADERTRSLGRAVLFGQVVDDSTGAPLAAVRVGIAGAPTELLTGTQGYFIISLTVGDRLALSFRRLGYRPHSEVVDVRDSDTTRISVSMVSAAHMLDTLSVRA